MKNLYFKRYGEMPYVEKSEYLKDDYSYVATEHEFYDESFDIVRDNTTEEYCYTQI